MARKKLILKQSLKNLDMEIDELTQYQQKNDCPIPTGILMIIGGGEDRDSVMKEYTKLLEKENPVIELVTTAGSVDVKQTYEEYKALFEKHIPCRVNHIHHNHR
ncbi:hypothetical protein [Pedobacter quisquiliarum]|nr:hypothetical protein [Pedobacter quisquiliarum]